jgi:hypothetical protein
MRVKEFRHFIEAREFHRKCKEAGEDPRIWKHRKNADPIIAKYRFCNVRRNDDRVTRWIHENYLTRFGSSPYLWFALVVARLFNNEDTLDAIKGWLLPFDKKALRKCLHGRARHKLKNFNAAYIVSTNGRSMNKVDYLVDHVLVPLWKNRDRLTFDMNVGQLANVHLVLCEQHGLSSFMAAQVIADWKYADDRREWDDFHTFVASGPGSKRGLNRVMGRDVRAPWKEMEFRETLLRLRDAVNARLMMEPITAQDIQNCLCEFDKYERVRLGEGVPKQLYKPKE